MAKTEPITLLFHWSPTTRRKGIIRYGLRPGMRPSASTPGWKPPYVCFADSPSWAWALSGDMHSEIESWDLWQTWTNLLNGYEKLPGWGNHKTHEVRTYERVYKRDLWYVGTR